MIDTVNGFIYSVSNLSFGNNILQKFNTQPGTDNAPVFVSEVSLFQSANFFSFQAGAVDATAGYAYVTAMNPSLITKVNISGGTPVISGNNSFNAVNNDAFGAQIDTLRKRMYTTVTKGVVVSDLGVGNAAPTVIAKQFAASNNNNTQCVVLDHTNTFHYTALSVGSVYRRDAGNLFSFINDNVGGLPTNRVRVGIIDSQDKYMYFSSQNVDVGFMSKHGTGQNGTTFAAVGALLNLGAGVPNCVTEDSANGFIYFGCETGKIVKVATNGNAAASTAFTLNTGSLPVRAVVTDSANGYAYFATSNTAGNAGLVYKVRFNGSNMPTVDATTTLSNDENAIYGATYDAINRIAYFSTLDTPGKIIKVALPPSAAAASVAATRVVPLH